VTQHRRLGAELSWPTICRDERLFNGLLHTGQKATSGYYSEAMTAAPFLATKRRHPVPFWLVAAGVLLSVAGLVGGFIAKRSADLASYVASQPTRMIGPEILSPTRMTGPTFDPTSAHYVAADYTAYWTGMLVVAVGLVIVIVSVSFAVVQSRRAV
jgi:protein-S-isoprenylcysteine O-methyltransferase Ste14